MVCEQSYSRFGYARRVFRTVRSDGPVRESSAHCKGCDNSRNLAVTSAERYVSGTFSGNLAGSMPKRTPPKRKAARVTSTNRRSAMPLSRNDKLTQPDLVILFSLAVVTLALHARVIGHQFITLDDPT